MKRELIMLFLVGSLLGLIAFVLHVYYYIDDDVSNADVRDENNCLVSEGYSYDGVVGACVKSWDMDNKEDLDAARIAIKHDGRNGLTVSNVEKDELANCYLVDVSLGEMKEQIKIVDGQVKEEASFLSVAECVAKSGRVVDVSLGKGCNLDEELLGEVNGCAVESVCCVDSF